MGSIDWNYALFQQLLSPGEVDCGYDISLSISPTISFVTIDEANQKLSSSPQIGDGLADPGKDYLITLVPTLSDYTGSFSVVNENGDAID